MNVYIMCDIMETRIRRIVLKVKTWIQEQAYNLFWTA